MQIHSLINTPLEEIALCFNKAFENYFVPLKLDAQQLTDKIISENILLEQSIGVSINSQLAGFILVGIDASKKFGYNAGTGIIPEFRGQKLTEKMYPYLLNNLGKLGIHTHLLEVISENLKALKIYENLGYSIQRKVICYKGTILEPKKQYTEIREIELPEENLLKPFRNHNPTYQNTLSCIRNNYGKHTILGAFDNERLIGYIVFDKNSLRIKQFGVDKAFRSKGIGHQLFYQVQLQKPDAIISMINIDENDLSTNVFLLSIGLMPFIEQYEMQLID